MSNQREIKFRAWDRERMWHFIELVSYKDGSISISVGDSFYNLHTLNERGILMQYTGLKDSHNKPIYEGDILRFIDDGKVYQVIYAVSECAYMLQLGNRNEYEELSCDYDKEVIGNIYEKPELLK